MKQNRQLNISMETFREQLQVQILCFTEMLQVLMQLASRVVLLAMASCRKYFWVQMSTRHGE